MTDVYLMTREKLGKGHQWYSVSMTNAAWPLARLTNTTTFTTAQSNTGERQGRGISVAHFTRWGGDLNEIHILFFIVFFYGRIGKDERRQWNFWSTGFMFFEAEFDTFWSFVSGSLTKRHILKLLMFCVCFFLESLLFQNEIKAFLFSYFKPSLNFCDNRRNYVMSNF